MKIVFFDCDETLWTSADKDYISSINSSLKKIDEKTLIREKDGKEFVLNKSVRKALEELKNKNILIGIVSDNEKQMVLKALKIFEIYEYFDEDLINIKLWEGYCSKDEMILESLSKLSKKILSKNIYWFDDKDYSKEGKEIGINFVKVQPEMNFTKSIKQLQI